MTETVKKDIRSFFLDKEKIRKIVAETYARMGIEPDPTATAEKAQEMMLAQPERHRRRHSHRLPRCPAEPVARRSPRPDHQ